jgi:hypothetical protein
MKDLFRRLHDWLRPWCPNGGHRIKLDLVTNAYGHTYCFHSDCIRANNREVKAHATNCPTCGQFTGYTR